MTKVRIRPALFPLIFFAAAPLLWIGSPAPADDGASIRPPAVPLVACDPYFSIWSASDRLTDSDTKHWTGRRHALKSLVRIDGKAFRLMGAEPAAVPALPQTGLRVFPTRTVYEFRGEKVALTLTFLTPALPDDLELLSLPVALVTWEARSLDAHPHVAQVYLDAALEIAVNTPDEEVVWSRVEAPGLVVLRGGSKDQPVLAKRGDDLRIDWGYLHLAAEGGEASIGEGASLRQLFASGKPLPEKDDGRQPRAARDKEPVLALTLDLEDFFTNPSARTAALFYDDLFSIRYFRQKLRPYWRRSGTDAAGALARLFREREEIEMRCRAFDRDLLADLDSAGGAKYARIGALAYRQCLAGCKLAADSNGEPLLFPKENFSNGCIATVDVIYPMLPQFLLLSPALAKASLAPVLDYGSSSRWRFPFAPHDLGTYPQAEGQVYGGGEATEKDQMPVEESGNLILLVAAVARAEGNASFAARYWPALARWAAYLKEKGLDPEHQLCTDDFAGHLAHNVNLSAKAILALGAHAQLAARLGKEEEAKSFRAAAEEFAKKWQSMAADGERTRLAFDAPGTWSQKYNLVWDRVLGLGLFPPEAMQKEMTFYRKAQNRYGLPLDSRKDYTKLDWVSWSACLTGSKEDFEALMAPVHDFLDASPSRIPMTDWYDTRTGKMSGFQARPVVGGVFLRLLDDPAAAAKWAARAQKTPGKWAPIPEPPSFTVLAPTSEREAIRWRFVMERPAESWEEPAFDDSAWKEGPGGFGTRGTPGAAVRTEWKSADLWLRREIELPSVPAEPLLRLHHDEDAEIYLNGVLAARVAGYSTSYEEVEISAAARAALRPGKNTMALHCHQTTGGQYLDAGIVALRAPAAEK